MTKTNINKLQKFIEDCDIISEKDGSVTFVLHDLFTLKKDGRPKNKLKLFEFLEQVAEKNKGHFFEDDECFFLRIPKQLKAKLDLTTCEEF